MGRERGIKKVHKGPLLFMGVTQSGWALILLHGVKHEVQSTGTNSQHVHMSYIPYVFTHTNLLITCRPIKEKQQNWPIENTFIKTLSNLWFQSLSEQIRLQNQFLLIWFRLAIYFNYITGNLQTFEDKWTDFFVFVSCLIYCNGSRFFYITIIL